LIASENHNEPESEGSSDGADNSYNNNSQGKGMLKPSMVYENEGNNIIDDVYNATSELLRALSSSMAVSL